MQQADDWLGVPQVFVQRARPAGLFPPSRLLCSGVGASGSGRPSDPLGISLQRGVFPPWPAFRENAFLISDHPVWVPQRPPLSLSGLMCVPLIHT